MQRLSLAGAGIQFVVDKPSQLTSTTSADLVASSDLLNKPTFYSWLQNFFESTSLKMLYHLFCRLFVFVGDLPVHDWHHRHASSWQWPNAIYARQSEIDSGHPQWPEPYTEVWGLGEAIGSAFLILSKLPVYFEDVASVRIEETPNEAYEV